MIVVELQHKGKFPVTGLKIIAFKHEKVCGFTDLFSLKKTLTGIRFNAMMYASNMMHRRFSWDRIVARRPP